MWETDTSPAFCACRILVGRSGPSSSCELGDKLTGGLLIFGAKDMFEGDKSIDGWEAAEYTLVVGK